MIRNCCWLGLLLVLAGCEKERESGPSLTGQLMANGQPCKPASVNDFDLRFVSVEGEGVTKRSYLAEVQPDGTFTVNGSIGRGIPVGRYKVSIAGRTLDAVGKPSVEYVRKFGDKVSPLQVELTDASRELVIDLGAGTMEVK